MGRPSADHASGSEIAGWPVDVGDRVPRVERQGRTATTPTAPPYEAFRTPSGSGRLGERRRQPGVVALEEGRDRSSSPRASASKASSRSTASSPRPYSTSSQVVSSSSSRSGSRPISRATDRTLGRRCLPPRPRPIGSRSASPSKSGAASSTSWPSDASSSARRPHRVRARWIDRRVDRRSGAPRDPQPAGIDPDLGQERPRRWRGDERIARCRSGRRVEERGAVPDGPGQDVLDGQAGRSSPAGARVFRPRVGLRPTSPQHEAGMRIEPAPSPPWAAGTMPEATAAADPPDDPPAVRSSAQGLRVGPKRTGSVVEWLPNSGVLVLPRTMRPARL